MNLFWGDGVKPIDFYGQSIDMAELTDNWTIGRSEAEFRLWKLTRAPMDEVKACVDLCFEERAAERKAAEKLVEVLTTQHCSVCGKRFSRELTKCPHCEQAALEKMQKEQKKAKRAENFNRFMDTTGKVFAVGNSLINFLLKVLFIICIPIWFVVSLMSELGSDYYWQRHRRRGRRRR